MSSHRAAKIIFIDRTEKLIYHIVVSTGMNYFLPAAVYSFLNRHILYLREAMSKKLDPRFSQSGCPFIYFVNIFCNADKILSGGKINYEVRI